MSTPTLPSQRDDRITQLNQIGSEQLAKSFERWFKLSDTWLNQAASQQNDPRMQQHFYAARQGLHRHRHRLQSSWNQLTHQELTQFWQAPLAADALERWESHPWQPTLARMIGALEARSPARLSQILHGFNRVQQRQQTLAQLPCSPTRLVCGLAELLKTVDLADDLQIPLLGKWEAALQATLGDVLGTFQSFLDAEQTLARTAPAVAATAPHRQRFSHLQAMLSLRGQRPAPQGSANAGRQPTQTLARTDLLDFADRFQLIQLDAHAGDPILSTTLSIQDFRFWLQQELNALEASQGAVQLSRADDDLITLAEAMISHLEHPLLPQPVRTLLLRLQVVLLKALLLDQAIFTDGEHPVRQYLNVIGRYSLGWKSSYQPASDPLLSALGQSVTRLLSSFQRDVAFFATVALWLDQSLNGEAQRRQRLAQRVVSSEIGRIRLERGQQFVDDLLARRIDGRALPAIGEILTEGPWRQALLHILLKQGADTRAWELALITTDQLIGSLQEPRLSESLTAQDRAAWIQRLPGMVRRLCSELDAIQCPQQRIGKITQELWQVHSARFQLHAEDLRQVPLHHDPEPVDAAWVAEALQQSRAQFAAPLHDLLNDLPPGHWVLLERGKNQYCAQIAGYVPDSASYLFVDYAGAKCAHLTRQQINSLKKQDRFQLIDPTPLADHALQNLVDGLRSTPVSTQRSVTVG